MCIILDANIIATFNDRKPESEPIRILVEKGKLKIAIGGKLTEELSKTRFLSTATVYSRLGFIKQFSSDLIEDQVSILRSKHASEKVVIESNDIHVLALAIVSGSRLLYTSDKKLKSDFKKKKIIPTRSGCSGKIYRDARDSKLLSSVPSCK